MRHAYISKLLLALFLLSSLYVTACNRAASASESATVDGRVREWLVHLPTAYEAGKPMPLVILYHGNGGSASGMERYAGLDAVADKLGFIVVYPSGYRRSWAAGLDTAADEAGVDDVTFTVALLDKLEKEYAIDGRHIVLAGFSNGSHMVELLGCRLADRITAIVPVSGTLASGFAADCKPARPISVIEFHGTGDPIDPYRGGPVGFPKRGSGEPVDQGIAEWAARDRCQAKPEEKVLRGADPVTIRQRDFLGCADSVEVRLYRLEGAGHVWPGSGQYLPERFIGRATQAIDASAVIGELAVQKP